MKLTVLDVFVAEGTEAECAAYTGMLLTVLKKIKEAEDQKAAEKELAAFERLMMKPLRDLMADEMSEPKDGEGDGGT